MIMKYNKIIKYKMSKPTPEQWFPNFFLSDIPSAQY